jgi:hypothetical protein
MQATSVYHDASMHVRIVDVNITLRVAGDVVVRDD